MLPCKDVNTKITCEYVKNVVQSQIQRTYAAVVAATPHVRQTDEMLSRAPDTPPYFWGPVLVLVAKLFLEEWRLRP